MVIDIDGEALRLLDHFVYYAIYHLESMASAMDYDSDGFYRRARALERIYNEAKYGRRN